MVKCGTVVSKAYSAALSKGDPVTARASWCRFILKPGLREFDPTDVVMSDGLGEVHDVPCKPTNEVFAMSDFERREFFLELLHSNALILARRRGWTTAPLEAARSEVIADDLRFRRSIAKFNPGRKLKARLDYEIDGNGDASLQVTVEDRAGVDIYQSSQMYAEDTVAAWNASKRTLHWVTQDEIVVTSRFEVEEDVEYNFKLLARC